jgi:hypothetical protein
MPFATRFWKSMANEPNAAMIHIRKLGKWRLVVTFFVPADQLLRYDFSYFFELTTVETGKLGKSGKNVTNFVILVKVLVQRARFNDLRARLSGMRIRPRGQPFQQGEKAS